jgi:fatty acid desaturase
MPASPSRPRLLRRKEDAVLLAYLTAIYAVLITFYFIFSAAPPWGRIAMFWIGSVLAGRIEAILHWTTHHASFRSDRFNLLHRLSYCLIPVPAIWYRYLHFHHHRFDNSPADLTSTVGADGGAHQSLPRYLLGSLLRPNYFPILRQMKPAGRREFWLSMSLTLLVTAVFFVVDWYATLLFWLPVTWISSTLVVALYNYTDHVPGDPQDPIRYATYSPLGTRYQRLLSYLDLHNISTHVTHHRFPAVYWADLPARQRREEPLYRARRTPLTFALNSGILFNPLAFLTMTWEVSRRRGQRRADAAAAPHLSDAAGSSPNLASHG